MPIVEGTDIVVLVILDALNSGNAEQWSEVRKLTEDRTELLRRFQNAYLEQHVSLNETERLNTLKAINAAGEIFYLLSRITREPGKWRASQPSPLHHRYKPAPGKLWQGLRIGLPALEQPPNSAPC